MTDQEARGFSTRSVHSAEEHHRPGDPVVPGPVTSSTFYSDRGPDAEIRYTRLGNNPTQESVAAKIADLEGMEAGLVLSSGMGAIAMTLLALTRGGGRIVAQSQLYGATHLLLSSELPGRGVETTFVEPRTGREWREAIRPDTRLLYLEMPTNPLLELYDPEPVVRAARDHGLPVVADVTFASPVNLRLGEHGVDVVVHSATKYLGGHSDLIAGAVAGERTVIEEVRQMMAVYGPSLDAQSAWLLDRGIRTLDLRMERHNRNALGLARWFEGQEGVERVIYPGLESHPQHHLAARLLDGFGGMLGVVLSGGAKAADAFCAALEMAAVAPSLGGVETLVSQPRLTSHKNVPAPDRARMGIQDGFIRISVGVEDLSDLEHDFAGALTAARGPQ